MKHFIHIHLLLHPKVKMFSYTSQYLLISSMISRRNVFRECDVMYDCSFATINGKTLLIEIKYLFHLSPEFLP